MDEHNTQPVTNHAITARVARTITAQGLCVPESELHVTRVTTGVSTWVFRARYRDDTFYLRVLPEVGASFAPEVAAHRELRRRGARVPEVVAFSERDALTERSVMLTTAIPGEPMSAYASNSDARAIFMAAGRDLARVNGVPVAGFGWVLRDQSETTTITAAWPTQRDAVLEWWDADLMVLARGSLSPADIAALRHVLTNHASWLDDDDAVLAHGDFDTTHIFQYAGEYSGIIDFGEVRGADHWYDLGHFHAHDGERLPYAALPDLLRGYGEIVPLPDDSEQRIRFDALLIAVRVLARGLQKRPANRYTTHLLRGLHADITALL